MSKAQNQEQEQAYTLHTYKRNYTNFTHGKNCRLFDEDGREYIDFSSGIAVSSVGHANERLTKAICDQAGKILHTSNLYYIEPQALLAEKIVRLAGWHAGCFFSNSGAEANEGAIKIARKYGANADGTPNRYKIISIQNSFHGRTLNTLKMTAQDKFHDFFGPYTDAFLYAQTLKEAQEMACAPDIAAVVIELVQGEGGVHDFCKSEVQELARTLEGLGVLLIVDEIQTGVWRTGKFLASQVYGIEPDIVTLAKGLGGGVPIGCVLTKKTEVLGYGDHGSTFGGNHLSTRAALEVLDILGEVESSGQLSRTIESFGESLDGILKEFGDIFSQKTGQGLLCGLRCANDDMMSKVIAATFENGLVVLKAGRSTVRFAPALTITKEEMDEGFDRLHRALRSL